MIVKCETCGGSYDDQFRWTFCPHNAFSANDGSNNFKVHNESFRVAPASNAPVIDVDDKVSFVPFWLLTRTSRTGGTRDTFDLSPVERQICSEMDIDADFVSGCGVYRSRIDATSIMEQMSVRFPEHLWWVVSSDGEVIEK